MDCLGHAHQERRSRKARHHHHYGAYTFKNALCDFGSSVNIIPKVIYKKINGSPLLYTTMCLQLAELSTRDLGHSLLWIHPPMMFFARAIISALETLRCATRVGSDCPQY
jgi:hypothetical protein